MSPITGAHDELKSAFNFGRIIIGVRGEFEDWKCPRPEPADVRGQDVTIQVKQ